MDSTRPLKGPRGIWHQDVVSNLRSGELSGQGNTLNSSSCSSNHFQTTCAVWQALAIILLAVYVLCLLWSLSVGTADQENPTSLAVLEILRPSGQIWRLFMPAHFCSMPTIRTDCSLTVLYNSDPDMHSFYEIINIIRFTCEW